MYQRILVPVDGSDTSNAGLDEAIKLAKLTQATIRLVHVVDEMIVATGLEPAGAMIGDLIPAMKAAGEKVVAAARERVQAAGIAVEEHLIENFGNRTSDQIVEDAKTWGADLIVIGTHGRRGMRRLMLGSDAEQILRMATVPVLLVHQAPKQA
ncbi:MAG: universal stress protein [Burkholderiaceae bacterium]